MNNNEKNVLSKSQKLSHWNSQKLFYSVGKSFQRSWSLKRGEVYFADLGENVGSEENKIRPVVVLQSNAYNFHSPVFTCAIISTSPMSIPDIQVALRGTYSYTDHNNIKKYLTGTIDLGQIKTIGKERIVSRKICQLTTDVINEIDQKLFHSLGLSSILKSKNNIITSLEGKVEYLKNKLSNLSE